MAVWIDPLFLGAMVTLFLAIWFLIWGIIWAIMAHRLNTVEKRMQLLEVYAGVARTQQQPIYVDVPKQPATLPETGMLQASLL